jgi:hypothetical protein
LVSVYLERGRARQGGLRLGGPAALGAAVQRGSVVPGASVARVRVRVRVRVGIRAGVRVELRVRVTYP